MISSKQLDIKEIYSEFVNHSNGVPLFYRKEWLDAVCGKNGWSAVIAANENQIQGVLPYYFGSPSKKYISMPVLTPYLGPLFNYPDTDKQSSIYSFEKKILTQLIEQIPSHNYFELKLHPQFTYGLPFHWKDYLLQHRFTYRILLKSALDEITADFKSEVRGKIRKAEKLVQVEQSDSVNEFLDLNRRTFSRQNMELPYSENVIQTLDDAMLKSDSRIILLAKDDQGNVHSGLYLVFDKQTMYVLMAGEDPNFRSSGAGSLLIHRAIASAMAKNLEWFDFCGSNIKSIETNRRAYGAEQVPYLFITKTSNKLLKIKHSLSYMLRG